MERSFKRQQVAYSRLPFFSTLLCLLLPLSSLAASLESVVEDFLREQTRGSHDELQITVYPPQAQFADCPSAVAFLPGRSPTLLGRVSVGIRCGDAHDSIRYINAEVSAIGSWPTVAVQISAGSEITADMLSTTRGELSRLPDTTLLDRKDIIGQVARRTLQPGQALRRHDIRSRTLVDRGQAVTIESGGAGFLVRRQGEALDTGGMGESIRVQLDRRNTLRGRITAQGTVRVQ